MPIEFPYRTEPESLLSDNIEKTLVLVVKKTQKNRAKHHRSKLHGYLVISLRKAFLYISICVSANVPSITA